MTIHDGTMQPRGVAAGAPRPGIEFEATSAVRPDTPHAWWTLRRAAAALEGQLISGPRLDDRPLSGVATDTRALSRGALFVALRGERFDAHALLADARAAGAAAVVIDDPTRAVGLGLPALVVRDTRVALGLLARGWRRAWGGTVMAVGGSNGKTSTKELLRAALGGALTVHATRANDNNLVGVPLTLLGTPAHAHVAVVEVGTNAPGEVAALATICEPDIALITSIGEEHLEGLGDLAGVLREEASLLDGVPLAIIPREPVALRDEAVRRAKALAPEVEVTLALDAEGRVVVTTPEHTVTLPVRGAHQANNVRLVLAAVRAVGVPLRTALDGMAAMPVPRMRGEWQQLGALTLINDAYNANPPSMRAALDLLDTVGETRPRVAVLGTMRELGAQSDALHDDIARRALQSRAQHIVAVGAFVDAFARVAPGDARVHPAADADQAWPVLQAVLPTNAVLLLKASRGVQLERLLPFLTASATT
ncbi:MAG: UDP-N-acetylmuramoyl-tripeptide--D-alanyl-D-alanine ligase [Gemmatimonadaceae bacterium]|nr:UDP-N-acetylmuramoyl-tripeptide--D-alanyl-D-alanine ligase [Gemmatimonadaceae bacterium]